LSQRLEDIDHVADLLDRLRLDVAARSKGVLVVEGPVDASILEDLLAGEGVAAFSVAGRNNVLRVADTLAAKYLRGIVCIADTDFDDEAESRRDQWFLVFTDGADIEAMALESDALNRVIESWGSSAKLTAVGGTPQVRVAVRHATEPLAILRRQSALRGLGINFDGVDLHAVVSKDDLSMSIDKLVGRLARASSIDENEIRPLLEADAGTCPHTGLLLVSGRDYLVLVDIALRKFIGSCSQQQVKAGLARKSLLLTLRPSDLAEAPFVRRLQEALARAAHEPEAALAN
jgi:hypothetical protein